jgi:hypothetical protein
MVEAEFGFLAMSEMRQQRPFNGPRRIGPQIVGLIYQRSLVPLDFVIAATIAARMAEPIADTPSSRRREANRAHDPNDRPPSSSDSST